MAAASLLEAEIVTADGEIRIANSCLNSDLFWALKGGGGGSFGVVTKLTLQTHELPEFFGGAGGTIQASDDASFRELVSRFMEFYAGNLLTAHRGACITLKPNNSLEISMASAGLSAADCEAAFKPFFDWVSASPGKFSFTDGGYAGATAARLWWDAVARARRGSKAMTSDDRPDSPPTHAWWKGDQEQVGAYLYGYDSVWLPEHLLKTENRSVGGSIPPLGTIINPWKVRPFGGFPFGRGRGGHASEATE